MTTEIQTQAPTNTEIQQQQQQTEIQQPAAQQVQTNIGADAGQQQQAAAQPAAAVAYEPTGDAGLDMALEFFGSLGINAADPAMQAAEQGNFALLEAKLGGMGDKAKGWERYLAVGKQGLNSISEKNKAKGEATEAAILSVFGEDKAAATKQWEDIRAWAKENAEPAELEAVNAALAAGGIAAKAMAKYLGDLYAQHPAANAMPSNAAPGARSAAPSSDALSPADYQREVAQLSAKLGGRMDGSQEYAALRQRRAAYRG